MLEDLEQLIIKCRKEYDAKASKSDIRISETLAGLLKSALSNIEKPGTVITPHAFSIELISTKGHRADIPSAWLWHASIFWPLAQALNAYEKTLGDIKTLLEKKDGVSPADIENLLVTLPADSYPEEPFTDVQRNFNNAIDSVLKEDGASQELFKKFAYSRKWWFKNIHESEATTGKKLNRGDAYDSSLILATRMVVASSGKITNLIRAFEQEPKLRDEFDQMPKLNEDFSGKAINTTDNFESAQSKATNERAENIIYYGAPGTGKSFEISRLTNNSNSTRTVFHPDTQYSDFVGCLKPFMSGENIQYSFRAGPFTDALIRAMMDQETHHYLIIEEINRAPAAAVFGEIFQLLDRDASGQSIYPVDIGDPDFLQYLETQLGAKWVGTKLCIPSNLTILATMNSSDQAVMPLDTAFKRRWKFKYQKLDFSNSAEGIIPLVLNDETGEQAFEWRDFAQAINQALSEHSIPEDRHLGPWFITNDELSPEKVKGTLSGKLFMYLWDDVLRHGRSTLVFHESLKTYGNLITQFETSNTIFSESFIKKLEGIKSSAISSSAADEELTDS